MKNSKTIKQWHTQQEPEEPKKIEYKPYILETKIEKTEFDEKGRMITTWETQKTDIFAKINETAKLLKKSKMEELINKINEIEEGV